MNVGRSSCLSGVPPPPPGAKPQRRRTVQRFPGEELFSELNPKGKEELDREDGPRRRPGSKLPGARSVSTFPPCVVVSERGQRFPRRETGAGSPWRTRGADGGFSR
ncbi:hypothetical protein CapIbe_008122 [Capra ibex]